MNYRSPDYMIGESEETEESQIIEHNFTNLNQKIYSEWVNEFLESYSKKSSTVGNVKEYWGPTRKGHKPWHVKITINDMRPCAGQVPACKFCKLCAVIPSDNG